MIERDILTPAKTLVIPNGMVTAAWPAPIRREDARAEFTFPADAFVWLAVGNLSPAKDYPTLLAAAERVAADLGLPTRWLNDGPADLFEMGLPAGFADRLQSRSYGTHLNIWFIDRIDQIYFKLYAAADQGPGQHVDDLMALHPTGDELLGAARWAFSHDVSPGFREVVSDMLTQLGHANVARQL